MNILKNLQQKILCSGETATPSTAFRATVERTASPPIALPYQLSVGRWHTDCRAPLNIVCIPNLFSSGVLSFGALTQTALQLPSFGITPNVPLFLHTLDLRSHHTGWCPQEASTPNPLTRPLPSSCKLSKSDESESPNGTVPRGEAKHPLPFDHMTVIADVANFLQGQTSTWAPNAFQGGAVLMGLGFGARAALTLAHAYPHLVQGVVAIAPHPLNSGEGAFPPLVAELRRAGEHLLDPRSWCGATRSSGGDATTAMSQAFQSLRPDHQAAIRSLLEAAPLQQDAAEAYECWAQSMTSLIHFAQTEATLSAVNFYQWLRLLHTQETGGIEACSVPVVLVEDDHGTTTSDGTGGEQVCLLEAELFRTIHRVKCSGLGDGCRTLCVSRDHAKNILTSSLSHLGLLSEESGMS